MIFRSKPNQRNEIPNKKLFFMIFGSARLWKIKKNTKRYPMALKLCRIHIHIILSSPAKNQVKIPSVAWRTQLVPPRKKDVSSCPAQKSLESSLGGVLLSAPPAPRPAWSPMPSRAPWACEGLGEGPGHGGTADGQPLGCGAGSGEEPPAGPPVSGAATGHRRRRPD